ncbi:MAG: pyridoxal phosphate-dependent aminotransferase [Candidatus Acidiferrales bacterium]
MPQLASHLGRLSSEGALEVFARARELERAGRSIIHLELGEPEFHPAPPVVEAAREALAAGRDRYGPSEGIPPLREAVVEYLAKTRNLHYRAENVLVAPGCKMALLMCLLSVIEAGSEVLYPDPGFPMYASVTRGVGAVPVPFRLLEANRFQPDVNEIASQISPRTRVLLLNSPGNPTGTVYECSVLEALADLARRHDLWVVSDEIYARIIYGSAYESIASLPGMAERTLLVDGFSKSFGMTGWRLGYAVAPPSVISALTLLVINSYSCVPDFLQRGAIEALHDTQAAVAATVAEFARRRASFVSALNRIHGFRCRPPDGAFYAWINIDGTGMDSAAVCRILLEEAGVAGIPGEAFGAAGKGFIRFSFAGAAAQLDEAIRRIAGAAPAWQPARAAGARSSER